MNELFDSIFDYCDKIHKWRNDIFRDKAELIEGDEDSLWRQGKELEQSLLEVIMPFYFRNEITFKYLATRYRLERILRNWTTPQKSIAPGPRAWKTMSEKDIEEGRRRLAELPPQPLGNSSS